MTLTPGQWSQVQVLFEGLSALPLHERAATLERACSDAEVRQEIVSLLAAADADDDWPDRPARVVERNAEPLPSLEPGLCLGPWRLLHAIGRGGMGEVYLGERADGAFSRKVAVKVLKRGLDTDQVVARFLRERRILGRLRHPRIAELLDAGAVPDGRPYLVMEYVEGQHITHWCESARPSVETLLRLLLEVCDAVHEAHANLIVHRDLKPSNVLVTQDGHIKLLDFGIAKALHEDDPESTHTRASAPLTPAFAAPEQLLGQDVSTATDVYALGVMLYLLLSGRLPHRRYSLIGAAAGLTDAQTEKPSVSALHPDSRVPGNERTRRAQLLKGDLDLIVLKALQPEPARRYRSAAELGQDLRRYLQHEPIAARPDRVSYVLRMFLRRHWRGVSVVGLLVLSIAIGALVALGEARVARAEAAKASAMRDFLVETLTRGGVGKDGGAAVRETTVGEVLHEATRRLPERFADQPETRAELLALLFDLNRDLESWQEALGLADARLKMMDARGASAEQRDGARLDRAEALHGLGDRPGAMAMLDEVARDLDARGETESAMRARWLLRHAWLDYDLLPETDPRARKEAARAVAMYDRLLPDSPQRVLGRYMLSELHSEAGDAAAARAALREGLALARKSRADGPWLVALGAQRVSRNMDSDDSLAWAVNGREAQAALREVFGPDHPRTLVAQVELGHQLFYAGQWAEGMRLIQEGLRKLERQSAANDPVLLDAKLSAGYPLVLYGHPEEAVAVLEPVAATYAATLPDSVDLETSLLFLGCAETELGRFAQAETHLREALRLAEKIFGDQGRQVPRIRYKLGLLMRETGRYEEAIAVMQQVLAEVDAWPPSRVGATWRWVVELGAAEIDLRRQRWQAAVQVGQKVLTDLRADADRATQLDTEGSALMLLGQARCELGEHATGLAQLREGVELLQKTKDRDSPQLADARVSRAACAARSGAMDEAARELALARSALEHHPELAPGYRERLSAAQELNVR